MTRKSDLNVTHIFPSGAWEVAAMVDGYREHRTYYGVTRKYAVGQFLAEVNELPDGSTPA